MERRYSLRGDPAEVLAYLRGMLPDAWSGDLKVRLTEPSERGFVLVRAQGRLGPVHVMSAGIRVTVEPAAPGTRLVARWGGTFRTKFALLQGALVVLLGVSLGWPDGLMLAGPLLLLLVAEVAWVTRRDRVHRDAFFAELTGELEKALRPLRTE